MASDESSTGATAYGGWAYVEPDEVEETETVEEHPDRQYIRDVLLYFSEGHDEAVIESDIKAVTDALLYHDAVEFKSAVTYEGEDEYGNPKHHHHDNMAGCTASGSSPIISFRGVVAIEDLGEVADAIAKSVSD